MNVLKFGGTSVGTPTSLKNLVKIVESRHEALLVVVSALGGITDLLISCAQTAAKGSPDYLPMLKTIIARHREMIDVMVKYNSLTIKNEIEDLLSQLSDIFRGISLLREVSPRSMDIIVSFGERMSSKIVAGAISNATHIDSLKIVKTEKWFNKNIAASELTTQNFIELKKQIKPNAPLIMGGFIARDKETDDITNLGRGGSDYTAALAAAALDADTLEIWTDVDGFMTADPRIISQAKVLEKISFIDSIELCNFGAKVVYPPTIYPVFHKNIHIRVLNTFNPSAPGTLICEAEAIKYTKPHVVGISSMKTVSLIKIICENNLKQQIYERALSILAKKGVQIVLTDSTISSNHNIHLIVSNNDTTQAAKALQDEFAPEFSADALKFECNHMIDVIAVVGEKINEIPGLTDTINLLALKEKCPIIAAPYSPTQTTYTIAIPENFTHSLLKSIHREFIEN